MTKKILICLGIIAAMAAVSCIYFSPTLEGKVIRQGDIQKYEAMAHEQKTIEAETGVKPMWTSSMFSGMPGYQVTGRAQESVFTPVGNAVTLSVLDRGLDMGIMFLYLLGFFLALLAFGVSPWIALVGALSFGLGSYNLIIIEAGHVTKAQAMGLMAPIMAGMVMTLRAAIEEVEDKVKRNRRVLWGLILFTVSLIIQIGRNHIQITFYTLVGCVAIGICYFVYAIIKKRLPSMLAKTGLLLLCAALAFGCNMRALLVNEEYAKYTMRGGNELTVTPTDLYGESAQKAAENTADGLDINYAFSWSYGVGETYTILVPGAMGGGSMEEINPQSSEFYKTFQANMPQYQYPWGEKAPLYWGSQPFTSGPVYFGAVVMLLFLLGMIVVKGPERWWILAATIISILLSWGGNFMALNGWLFDHVPLYNKFRTPSMALVLANACMVIMAALTLKELFRSQGPEKDKINRGLYIATGCLAAVIVGVIAISGSFDYSAASDSQLPDFLRSALAEDRHSLLVSDSWRSLLFIVLTAAALWLYNNGKIKKWGIALAIVGVLTVADLWSVGRRYLNDENFVSKSELELMPQGYDYDIDQKAAQYGDVDYRVYNLAVNTFNDSEPSAFHHQIGGYSAAKLSRYQNLIDFYLSRYNPGNDLVSMEEARVSMPVLNMLNARYLVLPFQQGVGVVRNTNALGNCWFVEEVKSVANADAEIIALKDFDPSKTAVVDGSQWVVASNHWTADSTDKIEMEHQEPYNPDHLRYRSHTAGKRLAVFSEIFYAPDWRAYIDGEPTEYIRVDFILRAIEVPAGDHVIEFKNETPRMNQLDKITLIISIVTLLAMIGAVVLVYRKKE